MRRVALLFVGCSALSVAACRDVGADGPSTDDAGTKLHIADIMNPDRKMDGAFVTVTDAVVLAVDTFDETNDGKSRGTIFVQDLGSHAKFSGTSLFSPSFIPGNLRVAPGDVLSLAGQFSEATTIGTTVKFPPGNSLPQLVKPIGTFLFDYHTPDPTVIDVNDLNISDSDPSTYANGRPWMNMLVTVNNVTLAGAAANDGKGRITAPLIAGGRNVPAISNELIDLSSANLTKGKTFKSVTGIVTYFFSFKIAPRSLEDLQE